MHQVKYTESETDWVYKSGRELQAIMELFEDSVDKIDLQFSEERAAILETLVSNPKKVIATLPPSLQPAAILFEPVLASSFDWNRDELATRLYITFLKEHAESDEALIGLVRLVSLSHQGGESLYESEAANILGVSLVCSSLPFSRIEDAGETLIERGLSRREEIQKTYEIIRRREEGMRWISAFIEEGDTLCPSKMAEGLVKEMTQRVNRQNYCTDFMTLSSNDRKWVLAKMYECFCSQRTSEIDRVAALASLHDLTESLGRSIEEVYGASLNVVADIDLSVNDLKEKAAEIVEGEIFGGGQLLFLALEKLTQGESAQKRRILNFISVVWDYYPTLRETIEGYVSSAIANRHIDKGYLNPEDPSFSGERPHSFMDFCGAVEAFDLKSSSLYRVPSTVTKPWQSRFRLPQLFGSCIEYELRNLKQTLSEYLRSIDVISFEAVWERCENDFRAIRQGGKSREEVLNRLESLGLLPSGVKDKEINDFASQCLHSSICLANIADRVSPPEGSGIRFKELKRRVLEIGRRLLALPEFSISGYPPPEAIVLPLISASRGFFNEALQFVEECFEKSPLPKNLERLDSEQRTSFLTLLLLSRGINGCHIIPVRDRMFQQMRYSSLPKWPELFTEEEYGKAYLNVVNKKGLDFILDMLSDSEIKIPTNTSSSRKIADSTAEIMEYIRRNAEDYNPIVQDYFTDERTLDFLKAVGVTESSHAETIYSFVTGNKKSSKDCFAIAESSSRKAKETLLACMFNEIFPRIEKDPRGREVHYPTPTHKRFVEKMVKNPKIGHKVAAAVLYRSVLADNIEIFQFLGKISGENFTPRTTSELRKYRSEIQE